MGNGSLAEFPKGWFTYLVRFSGFSSFGYPEAKKQVKEKQQ
jgi:hypothetical protein